MKPIILLYHLPEGERLAKIKRALFPLGMKLRAVKKEEYLEPVGYLAGDEGTRALWGGLYRR